MSDQPVPPSPSSSACVLQASCVIAGFDYVYPKRKTECSGYTPKSSPSLIKARVPHISSKTVSPYSLNGSPSSRNRRIGSVSYLISPKAIKSNGKTALSDRKESKDNTDYVSFAAVPSKSKVKWFTDIMEHNLLKHDVPYQQSGRSRAGSVSFHQDHVQTEPRASLSQLDLPLNLNEFLNSDVAYTHFLAFLKTEYSEENLLFWKAVDNFHRNANIETARQIYFEYIQPEAPNEINISFITRQAIEKALSLQKAISENPTENKANTKGNEMDQTDSGTTAVDSCVFDEAQMEITKLIQRDVLPRFRQSPHWFNYLATNQARI